ncbi:MAG: hypothetical protein HZB26_20895, partial [Candidatus Hydrogenedentes bacterium]|nr:hypothetical protein [Candidatus Hydrogenedentota bacterium]
MAHDGTLDKPGELLQGRESGVAWRNPLIAVFLVALALRLYHLGSAPLGPNEASALLIARHGSSASSLSPLFLGLSRLWIGAGLGSSEWLLRLLPFGFGLGVVAGAYGLGK